jgi:hypothetical protein
MYTNTEVVGMRYTGESLALPCAPGITIHPGIGYKTVFFGGGPNEPWHTVSYKKKGRKARKWKGTSDSAEADEEA